MKSFRRVAVLILVIFSFFLALTTSASQTFGTIDPNNTGQHFVAFTHIPSTSGSEIINFGKFTTESHYDITVTDAGLRGYAWGNQVGWIVMNCADTTSGCSSVNDNFKVSVGSTGILSGYAWGQQAGWINFGPFLNNTTPQVQISQSGQFGGTSGTAGYAWS